MNNSVSDPTDFAKSSIPNLSQVDSLLRCHICKNFLKTPVLTPCGHTFCSLCIRSYLNKEAKCPLCLHELRESMLQSEYLVNEVVETYQSLREQLLNQLIHEEKYDSHSDKDLSIVEIEPDSDNVQVLNVENEVKSSISKIMFQKSNINDRKPVKKVTKKTNDIHSFLKSRNNETTNKGSKLVECPICSKLFSKHTLEQTHLDQCLTNESLNAEKNGQNEEDDDIKVISEHSTINSEQKKTNQMDPNNFPFKKEEFKLTRKANTPSHLNRYLQSAASNNVQRLPKINFSPMMTSQIKQKLSSLNLPIAGNRQMMIDRYNHYEVLWNSNFCDSINPVDERELRRQLLSWEASQRNTSMSNVNSIASLMKKANPGKNTISYQQLMSKYKTDQFDRKAWIHLFSKQFKVLKKEAKAKLKNKLPEISDTSNIEHSNDLIHKQEEYSDILNSEDIVSFTQKSESNDSLPDITIAESQEI